MLKRKENVGFENLSFNNERCNSLSEILEDLNGRKNNPVRTMLTKQNLDYDFYCESEIFDESSCEYLLRKTIVNELMEKYNKCENSRQKDDMLIDAILEFYPDALDEYPLLSDIKKTRTNESDLALIDSHNELDNTLTITNWLKIGRRVMGIGLEKVKEITAKYRCREKKELSEKDNQKDMDD